ncbi:MAG TPA: hybrid sensor histidine kinase/response regulator [Holosporales bacterium]|nr:hybrid sensor histidine kinase/response regulator [Holosporales bacterium]
MFWNKRLSKPSSKQIEEVLSSYINSAPIAIVVIDATGVISNYNDAFSALINNSLSKNSDIRFDSLLPEEQKINFINSLASISASSTKKDALETEILLSNGEEITVSLFISCHPEGSDSGVIIYVIDTTEQKKLETRFVHSQKMQAVGQLAGGIAHDFNNLLTAMIGFCDLLLMRHPAGDPSFADIMQVKQNSNRAANLVRQLLAFSRKQTLQPKNLDLTEVLAELSNLIRRLIGENIELNMIHGRDLWMVKADQGQLEQVIINLAVNARDAMQKGGTLTIRTSNISIDGRNQLDKSFIPPAQEDNITDGEYVLTEVIDSGHGIPAALIEKIFEPFFSTKEVGHGTGLGLSTVYGIIKQTGGFLYVKTEEDIGTTFAMFLPKHLQEEAEKENAEALEKPSSSDLTGTATILLVEDETPVRIFAARALGNKGYKMLEADCGENALQVYEQHGGKVDVIISDVIMPGMNGPTMIETLRQRYPEQMKETQVIFISGYAEGVFVDNLADGHTVNFLPKPFTLKQLASKVKEVLTS